MTVGGIFWLFVFGMFYRLLKYFRGIPEIGAQPAGEQSAVEHQHMTLDRPRPEADRIAAEKAGIKQGDVIVKVNGKAVFHIG